MEERMRERLAELHEELLAGERRLRELDEERAPLQRVRLRIAGAAQVVEELLAAQADGNGGAAPPRAAPPDAQRAAAGAA